MVNPTRKHGLCPPTLGECRFTDAIYHPSVPPGKENLPHFPGAPAGLLPSGRIKGAASDVPESVAGFTARLQDLLAPDEVGCSPGHDQ